ncbi:MAG: DMT family transporter [Treponema sp.]|jgi:drug/metabolite transporter (DMT)-like permease|nr:DMT family transporter [Treponema sp.]
MNLTSEKSKPFLGYFFAFVAIFIWGITFISTKSLLKDFSSLEILFYRFILAYLSLWIIYPKKEKFIFKDNILFLLAGLTGVTLYQFTENVAISYTSASNVSIIVSSCPLFTAIISQIFLKEKHISLYFIIGFIVTITGIALVSINGTKSFSLNPKGDFLALLASISWGFYSLFISILNKRHYSSIGSTRRIFFFAIILMIPLILVGSFQNQGSSLYFNWNFSNNYKRFLNVNNILNFVFLGVFASGICFSIWKIACNNIGTVKTTSGLYLIPVVTIIFAFFVLDEKITSLNAIGSVITITGLFISGYKKKN